jgi:hypothetical protein
MNQVINIPEGFELKKVSETEYKIVPKERRLPKTWEEFCEISNRIHNNEYFITTDSSIVKVTANDRYADLDKNVCPSKEIAEGILALIQLIQLRDYYNNGWKPTGYCSAIYITNNSDPWIGVITVDSKSPLAFKSADLAKEFANNFKDLIDKVKYLF